jgi:NAD(P)-dependent dehydrogenase (short-subunit alcohol dehydrogenase family)
MRQKLDDKVVLVTGAARGIGAETARRLVSRGARVSLVGLEPERLAALAGELGDRAVWFEADVTDQEAVDGAVAGTVAAFGGIDVVIANAGIANNGTVAVNPADALVRTIDVNVSGVVRTVSSALPHIVDRRGYVLIIASAASFTVLPGMAAYAASKAGVEQFANALSLEVAHKGVRVGSAHPSWIDTDLVRDQKAELKTFADTLEKLPWPMNSTTSVEECADALVDGIARRRRRIYIPRTLAIVQALRSLFTGPVAELLIRRRAKTLVPELEAEITRLGRWFGGSSVAMPSERKAPEDPAVPKLPT